MVQKWFNVTVKTTTRGTNQLTLRSCMLVEEDKPMDGETSLCFSKFPHGFDCTDVVMHSCRLSMFDSMIDSRQLRRRRAGSSSSSSQASGSRSRAAEQELEITRLQEALRQQSEYQRAQNEYQMAQSAQNEYYANLAAQQTMFLHVSCLPSNSEH